MAKVDTTQIIFDHFQYTGANLQQFVNLFSQWKDAGSAGEDRFHEFGKDSAYGTPHVNGDKNILRHVHLVPVLDQDEKDDWYKKFKRGSRRTSNRVLVYVNDGDSKFLLIAVLEEPLAHEIARMKTSEDKEMMELFAKIAEEFIYRGEVIA